MVGKFLKVSKSNKSRRAFQVILCLAETAALRIMATWANTVLESQSVWGRPLLTEHFSRENRYIFVWKQNKGNACLGWRCLRKSCHFRFIHTWLHLLLQYVYHHMLLLLGVFLTVSQFNIRIINCCIMTYDQLQMLFLNGWGIISVLCFYVRLALCFSRYFSRLWVKILWVTALFVCECCSR